MRESHVCGDCGLSVQKMHRYHRDCIAALRTELAEAQQRVTEFEETHQIQDDALLKVNKAWREQRERAEQAERELRRYADDYANVAWRTGRDLGYPDSVRYGFFAGYAARAAEPDGQREALEFAISETIWIVDADPDLYQCMACSTQWRVKKEHHEEDCWVEEARRALGVADRRPYDPPSVCARCGAEHFVGQSHKCVADSPPEEHAG